MEGGDDKGVDSASDIIASKEDAGDADSSIAPSERSQSEAEPLVGGESTMSGGDPRLLALRNGGSLPLELSPPENVDLPENCSVYEIDAHTTVQYRILDQEDMLGGFDGTTDATAGEDLAEAAERALRGMAIERGKDDFSVVVLPDFDRNAFDVIIRYDIIGADIPPQELQFVLQSNR